MHDNLVKLLEPEDYYMLSQNFWEIFRDRYGCDVTIQLRRYESFEKLLPGTIVKGNFYSSFDPQIESWYDPIVEDWHKLEDKEKR